MCVGYAQTCVITGHVSVSLLAPPEARLAPAEERRHALLVVVGQARQRELVDVHVACESSSACARRLTVNLVRERYRSPSPSTYP
jgi:hypothetical protein